MHTTTRLAYRTYQLILKAASPFLPWRTPEILEGSDSFSQLAQKIKQKKIQKILIVTDATIVQLDLLQDLEKALKEEEIQFSIYDGTIPDPTVEIVKATVESYVQNQCEAIIAFGGGSPIDCSKAAAALLSNPRRELSQMAGLLKVRRRKIPLYAVPTTAGTGSEATITSVITDAKARRKYTINDLVLIPDAAVLNPSLLLNLPAKITAATGMDALSHAVEAYIGRSTTRKTRNYSREAISLIFENLTSAFEEGKNPLYRQKMQLASFRAGQAFTQAYVGYVHAIAHTLGGRYHIPHGVAIAILLPRILREYGTSVYKPLAELADCLKLTDKNAAMAQKAESFISAIEELNGKMGIPGYLPDLKDEDISSMISDAMKEAHPLYPTPQIWNKETFLKVYQSLHFSYKAVTSS